MVERCELDFKNMTPLVLNSPMLKQMSKLYTRHAFEHMLFQYMHSHYLVVTSKENADAAQPEKVRVGYKSNTNNALVGTRLKAGVYTVSDPSDNSHFHVQVRQIGAPLRRNAH